MPKYKRHYIRTYVNSYTRANEHIYKLALPYGRTRAVQSVHPHVQRQLPLHHTGSRCHWGLRGTCTCTFTCDISVHTSISMHTCADLHTHTGGEGFISTCTHTQIRWCTHTNTGSPCRQRDQCLQPTVPHQRDGSIQLCQRLVHCI